MVGKSVNQNKSKTEGQMYDMTIRDLLKRVPEEDYDKVLIITMPDGGWTNIENAVSNGSIIELSMDISNSPFTSDK